MCLRNAFLSRIFIAQQFYYTMHTLLKGLMYRTQFVFNFSTWWLGLCLFVLLSCTKENTCTVTIISEQALNDTLYIQDFVTNKRIAAFPLLSTSATVALTVNQSFIAHLYTKKERDTDVMLFSAARDKQIRIDSTAIRSVNNVADSLLQYQRLSTNLILRDQYHCIADYAKPMRVYHIFDSARIAREKQIEESKALLYADERVILKKKNTDNVYSFLFFYGTQLNRLPYDHVFFDFIKDIEVSKENIYTPTNALRKLEIEFIREKDTLRTIQEFIEYADVRVKEKELADFLKLYYVKEVIGSPNRWPLHKTIVNTDAIKAVLEKEKNNAYRYLIEDIAESFYATQKGKVAYNFAARDFAGNTVHLSDYKGKFVLLDVWATWCGPCMDTRKELLAWAKKNKEQQEVVILFVSVDSSLEKWKKEVAQTNAHGHMVDVWVEGEFNGSFAQNYLIQFIPKYILIDKEGKIVHANLTQPIAWLEKTIASNPL
jgi:thiol-disulfide isomerase/thioredoxin